MHNNNTSSLINRFACVALALTALVLGGCATRAPMANVDAAAPAHHDYLIGPGDNVNINVWRNPEVSMSVPVRPDGKITTPLVEDLPAAGKTAPQLARDIDKALGKYIQQPVVTVIVTGFVGTYGDQIRVIGQAARPQALVWALERGSRSGRVAYQFARDYAGTHASKA